MVQYPQQLLCILLFPVPQACLVLLELLRHQRNLDFLSCLADLQLLMILLVHWVLALQVLQ